MMPGVAPAIPAIASASSSRAVRSTRRLARSPQDSSPAHRLGAPDRFGTLATMPPKASTSAAGGGGGAAGGNAKKLSPLELKLLNAGLSVRGGVSLPFCRLSRLVRGRTLTGKPARARRRAGDQPTGPVRSVRAERQPGLGRCGQLAAAEGASRGTVHARTRPLTGRVVGRASPRCSGHPAARSCSASWARRRQRRAYTHTERPSGLAQLTRTRSRRRMSSMDSEEKLVLDHIKEAGNMGACASPDPYEPL